MLIHSTGKDNCQWIIWWQAVVKSPLIRYIGFEYVFLLNNAFQVKLFKLLLMKNFMNLTPLFWWMNCLKTSLVLPIFLRYLYVINKLTESCSSKSLKYSVEYTLSNVRFTISDGFGYFHYASLFWILGTGKYWMMNLKYYISERNSQIKGVIKKSNLLVLLYVFF